MVMGSAIGLREDFDGVSLRRLARLSKSAIQARRLLALAQIYDGGSRSGKAAFALMKKRPAASEDRFAPLNGRFVDDACRCSRQTTPAAKSACKGAY
jgi:hypothetical protein